MNGKYHKIENYSAAEEAVLNASGKATLCYGRLKEATIRGLCEKELSPLDPHKLLSGERPWRLNRFLREMAAMEGVEAGEARYRDVVVRVIDSGIANALGKGSATSEDEDSDDLEANLNALKPWDDSAVHWEGFSL